MPTYEYVCRNCGHMFEIVQSMSDAPLTICDVCGGELRKVFTAPSISFKGSGFYATDSRSKGGKHSEDTSSSSEKSDTSGKKDSSKEPAKSGSSGGEGGSKAKEKGGDAPSEKPSEKKKEPAPKKESTPS
jgi:putative FmdB family regulatory protein